MERNDDPFEEFNKNFGKERHEHTLPPTIIWQCYKNVPQGRWQQIPRNEIKDDVGLLPKYIDSSICFIKQNGRDYYIHEMYNKCAFYIHQNKKYAYMIDNGLIDETMCFSDYDSALSNIKKSESANSGKIVGIRYLDNEERKAVGLPIVANINNSYFDVNDVNFE